MIAIGFDGEKMRSTIWHIMIPWKWFYWGRGQTIGPIILLHPDAPKSLYGHELVHVYQLYREPFTFFIKYLYFHLKYGYWKNPYEIEAYRRQDEFAERYLKDVPPTH